MAMAERRVSRSGEYTVAKLLQPWLALYIKPNGRPSAAGNCPQTTRNLMVQIR